MSTVLDFLKAFNRKERYFLLNAALGGFALSADYRDQLGQRLNLTIPENAYVAMDYHLTWLYASLFLAAEGLTPQTAPSRAFSNEEGIVRGNQEDVDLLVAFDDGEDTHIIVIEAKGVTGWTNTQIRSKAGRLREIFGEAGMGRTNVFPHFVLTSPRESAGLTTDGWPSWMSQDGVAAWIPLPLPEDLVRVSRSDESGRASAAGHHWTVLREGRGPTLS